jgi:SAM-dependent methyltransferase
MYASMKPKTVLVNTPATVAAGYAAYRRYPRRAISHSRRTAGQYSLREAVSQGLESQATEWIAWARTPGHDAYWSYRDAFFALTPVPGRRTLEVGCGEGRVCRDLSARGHRVTGLDASPTLVRVAQGAHPDGEYVVGLAEALPFANGTFDLVVAYNSLMDVGDMPRAIAEAARVLESGGRLCACIVHPIAFAGEWTRDDARFVITDSYLERAPWRRTFERDGLRISFDNLRYPLQDYSRALEDAGFLIEALREPAHPTSPRWSRLPGVLLFRALKP